jgi:3-hydroxyacyl-CoA dehydrogenase
LCAPGLSLRVFDSHKTPAQCKADCQSAAAPHGERALALVERVLFCDSLELACNAAKLVCEAISESAELKQELFAALERVCADDAVFATNSLSLRLSDISAHMQRPVRLIGLRFLYPVLFIPFCEITVASSLAGNAQVAQQVLQFMQTTCRKIVITFDVTAALEGETEAEFLALRRGCVARVCAPLTLPQRGHGEP